MIKKIVVCFYWNVKVGLLVILRALAQFKGSGRYPGLL